MGVHVVRPDGDGPFPVIVFFHHGPGLDEGAKKTMGRIAEWGYYVVAHDRYHRAEPWYTMQSRSDEEVQKMFGLILGTSEDQVAEDLTALLAWLPSDPSARGGALGCIGYCIGARSVLRTIGDRGEQFRAAVGLHPSFCTTDDSDSPHLAVPSYTGSLYIAFGSADTMQPASANTALIEATNALPKGEAGDPRRRGPRVRGLRAELPRERGDTLLRSGQDRVRSARSRADRRRSSYQLLSTPLRGAASTSASPGRRSIRTGRRRRTSTGRLVVPCRRRTPTPAGRAPPPRPGTGRTA